MEFLIGKKNEFYEFVEQIPKDSKIAVVSHTDFDGIMSALFLENLFKSRKIESIVKFISYKDEKEIKEVFELLEKNKVSRIVFSDIALDSTPFFDELDRKNIFIIDHHPMHKEIKNKKWIIKSPSWDCACLVIYHLAEKFCSLKKWDKLLCSAVISEFSFKKRENMNFLKKVYPDINESNIFDSAPGKYSNLIANALVYFSGCTEKAYSIIKKEKFDELEKYSRIIEKEINKHINLFKVKSEFFSEYNLYFYCFTSKFKISSRISSLISLKNKNSIFIFCQKDRKEFSISARSQSGERDIGMLIKKAVSGLEDAGGGGHKEAGGAHIQKRDLKKFKENILKEIFKMPQDLK